MERRVHVGIGEAVGFGIELGQLSDMGAVERVEIGGAVAQGAVGGNQAQHGHLLLHGSEIHAACCCAAALLCQVGKGFLNRAMRHIFRGVAGHGGYLVEILPPLAVHGVRGAQIGFVQIFNIRDVGTV